MVRRVGIILSPGRYPGQRDESTGTEGPTAILSNAETLQRRLQGPCTTNTSICSKIAFYYCIIIFITCRGGARANGECNGSKGEGEGERCRDKECVKYITTSTKWGGTAHSMQCCNSRTTGGRNRCKRGGDRTSRLGTLATTPGREFVNNGEEKREGGERNTQNTHTNTHTEGGECSLEKRHTLSFNTLVKLF